MFAGDELATRYRLLLLDRMNREDVAAARQSAAAWRAWAVDAALGSGKLAYKWAKQHECAVSTHDPVVDGLPVTNTRALHHVAN
eukprot:6011124-Amphidinium_carterae.2